VTLLLFLLAVQAETPARQIARAVELRDAGKPLEALAILDPLAREGPDAAVKEHAHFERAGAYFKAAEFETAHQDYEAFLLRFPQSERLTAAKRMVMVSALELARAGATTLGVPTGAGAGIDALRDALKRFPREEFSADFAQKFGMFFWEREEWDRAAEEFSRVLDQYGDAPEAVLALYMLGRCADQRFDALDYDSRPLRDSRRHYERFLDESEKLRRLPEPARSWVDRLLPSVQERLGTVYERLLGKKLKAAAYYEWKGLPKSARPFYVSIVKEDALYRKTLPSLAETEALRSARRRLPEIAP
jgi:outer membrane protein assembly factor BamD (BamD/ComL family)